MRTGRGVGASGQYADHVLRCLDATERAAGERCCAERQIYRAGDSEVCSLLVLVEIMA